MKFAIDLLEDEAWALAEMCKRFDRDHAKRLADAYDDGAEMENMLSAMMRIRRHLKEAGYSPR